SFCLVREKSKGLCILSINWSKDLISSVLSKREGKSQNSNPIPIFSNTLVFCDEKEDVKGCEENSEDERCLCATGAIDGNLNDGIDKWKMLNEDIKRNYNEK